MLEQSDGAGAPPSPVSMRDAIKTAALDLLIRHGYRGANFGDIAAELATTRANIHYHFGNKQALVDEVLADYVETTLTALSEIWGRNEPFRTKLDAMIAYSRKRYDRHNPAGIEGRPWSLISRLRQDTELLSAAARVALIQFGRDMAHVIAGAVDMARRNGEFATALPVEDVALHLATLADNAAPITIEAQSFERLERLYRGFADIVLTAFPPRTT